MPKHKIYYYYVQVSPNINRGVLHFKAINKKQIMRYFKSKYISEHAIIFDPTSTPTEGVTYIDASKIEINKII